MHNTNPQCPYPDCRAELTNHEVIEKECWTCGREFTPLDQPSGPLEWDTDDDEAMPNLIKR